ncbi:MAG: hypothetical protein LBQ77_02225 [Treponema sp.]|jgi:hypothetical protein|nr:hypothetical protein [Treponema sp.]
MKINGILLFFMVLFSSCASSVPYPYQDVSSVEYDSVYREPEGLGSILPPYDKPLTGDNEIRVHNPNSYPVLVGIRNKEDSGIDIIVPAQSTGSGYVPDGNYAVYFVFSPDPNLLFRGDNIRQFSENIAEIQFGTFWNDPYYTRNLEKLEEEAQYE